MRIKAFVITLEGAQGRREQVKKILETCPVEAEVLSGIDGRKMSSTELERNVRRKLYYPSYPFQLRPGEIGHFLSQRKAWQTIIDQQLDAALLLEDDIEFELPLFCECFELALSHLTVNSLIKFRPSKQPTSLQPRVIVPRFPPLGTTSYIVTRAAAERLLKHSTKFDRPTDCFIQLSWITGVYPMMVLPAAVREISHCLGGSTIQVKKRSFAETIYRNLARPWYRSRLKGRALWEAFRSPGQKLQCDTTDVRRAA